MKIQRVNQQKHNLSNFPKTQALNFNRFTNGTGTLKKRTINCKKN